MGIEQLNGNASPFYMCSHFIFTLYFENVALHSNSIPNKIFKVHTRVSHVQGCMPSP